MAYMNGKKINLSPRVTIVQCPVDQIYNPESENPQSGHAMAGALERHESMISSLFETSSENTQAIMDLDPVIQSIGSQADGNRMNIEDLQRKSFKFITRTTLTEDAKQIKITKDICGNAFNLGSVIIAIKLNINPDEYTKDSYYFHVFTDNKARYLGYRTIAKNNVIIAMVDAEIIGESGITRGNLVLSSHATDATVPGSRFLTGYPTIGDAISTPIKDITIGMSELSDSQWVTLLPESTVEVWGCEI